MTCSLCSAPVFARGWCQRHWTRWRRTGDPLNARHIFGTLPERLAFKVDSSGGPDACHPFTGKLRPDGYGRLSTNGSQAKAHIVAYENIHGPVPSGLTVGHVCHDVAAAAHQCQGGPTCPHRACCNPRHLAAQTRAEQAAAGAPAQRTHCPHGHEYTPENTYLPPSGGGRQCQTCRTNRNHARTK